MVCAYNAIPRANVETSEVAKNRAQYTLTDGGRLYAVLYFYIPVLYRQLYSSLCTLYSVLCALYSVLCTLYSTLAPIPLKTLDVFFN